MTDINQILVGTWTYRSFLNDPKPWAPDTPVEDVLFGNGNIRIDATAPEDFDGLIYGEGWQLTLRGYAAYGNPYTVRFQGKGIVSGAEWIYDYRAYLVPRWPNGVNQRPALVGSIVRTIPHPSGNGGVAPAGVTASWFAVKQD